jgi:hypothetical protein
LAQLAIEGIIQTGHVSAVVAHHGVEAAAALVARLCLLKRGFKSGIGIVTADVTATATGGAVPQSAASRPLTPHAARSTRVSISLRSVAKSIGLVNSASAPFSKALRFVSASP